MIWTDLLLFILLWHWAGIWELLLEVSHAFRAEPQELQQTEISKIYFRDGIVHILCHNVYNTPQCICLHWLLQDTLKLAVYLLKINFCDIIDPLHTGIVILAQEWLKFNPFFLLHPSVD